METRPRAELAFLRPQYKGRVPLLHPHAVHRFPERQDVFQGLLCPFHAVRTLDDDRQAVSGDLRRRRGCEKEQKQASFADKRSNDAQKKNNTTDTYNTHPKLHTNSARMGQRLKKSRMMHETKSRHEIVHATRRRTATT